MSLRGRFIHTRALQSAFLASILGCALIPPSAHAQPEKDPSKGQRPASAGRVVRAFDFEEQDYNPLPVPLGWIRAQDDPQVPRIRPGFPIWNGAVLDYKSPAFAGVGTVRLPTSGGSTSLVLRRGEINIFPNADYLVSARVKTEGLNHAKARVVAYLLDRQGGEIPGAQSATPLANTGGQWEQLSLEIEGVYPKAAFLKIELQLLQPKEQFADQGGKRFEVWDQDYQGNAFFDNLIIAQLPRLEMTTGTPGNIVESKAPPAIKVLVRDLTGDAIVANIRVFDIHGTEVDSQVLTDGSRRVRTDWTPSLPGFGWYRAMLQVAVDEQLVGVRMLDFVWASPNRTQADSGMFGISARLTNPKIAQSASALVQGAGVSQASIELWAYQTSQEDLEPESIMMQTVGQLIERNTSLSITLSQLPSKLANTLAIDPDRVVEVFSGSIDDWEAWGGSMLDDYGQAVQMWRFGDKPTQESPEKLQSQLETITQSLKGYVPGPILITPWSIERQILPKTIANNQQTLLLDAQQLSDQAIELLIDDWVDAQSSLRQDPGSIPPTLAMQFSPLQAASSWSGVESWSSLGALARKAITFWWSASTTGLAQDRFGIELADAWSISQGKRGQVMPSPELVMWRTLATHLGTRQALEELDVIEGVTMLVAGPKSTTSMIGGPEDGLIVLWLDDPTIEPQVLSLPLSTGPVAQYDVFNNKTVVEVEKVGELGIPIHRIPIGRSPIIITGVNAQLVRFLGSIKLTPERLQASSGVHKHQLILNNPWPMTVRGQVFIVEPGGYTGDAGNIDRSWEIRPRVFPFVLDPGERDALPVNIAYSLGEIAGNKRLVFDVEIQSDKDYPLIRVQRSIELGLDGVEMHISARKGDDGVTVVRVRVTNKFASKQDFEVVAIPPKESRLRRSIAGIEPEETVVREFAFTKTNSGDEIIVALLLRESSVRLNKSVIVP